MSIFKVLESNIEKGKADFDVYLSGLTGDALRGTEFMFYALSNLFKDKEIQDLEVGIVDSGYRGEKYDFGVDAVYITAANDFLENSDQVEDYNQDTKFVIHLLQFKRGTGIAQADLLKFKTGIQKCLIDETISDTDNLYFSNRMVELNDVKSELFRNFPSENISVICHIVFGGMEDNIHKETILSDELKSIIQLLNSSGYTNCEILISDCQMLINAPSGSEKVVDIIEYQKTFKYITDTDNANKLNGYISIIKGQDIAELVRRHQSAIFEANIRDYFKRNDINSKITSTCSSDDEAKFFWSYNNGLTMTCSKVEEMPNNKYRLHNIQIVNGCQTSNALYAAVKNRERVTELLQKQEEHGLTKKEEQELTAISNDQFNDSTTVLVKIIETNNDDFIYRITETTNSQTPIKAFSLKANDDIQKLIEKYFENNNINYERRINFLRNKGKKNIFSIQKLFQLYTSQILFRPSQVKNEPKKLFLTTYDDVFPAPNVKSVNYLLYLVPVLIDIALSKGIKDYLKANPDSDPYVRTLLTYGNYHLGAFILSSILKADYNDKGIVNKESFLINEIHNNFPTHLADAIDNFEKLVKNQVGSRKEAIPGALRKADLDNRIVRFIKSRK